MTISSVTTDTRLGRLLEFDNRSYNFSISDFFTELRSPETKLWDVPLWLDQGREGACVGFGWSNELQAAPDVIPNITNESAHALYKQAQELDPWPGNGYEGSSVLAGAKALMQFYPDVYDSYRWAFGIGDVISTISFFGPVVLGVIWKAGMYPVSSQGIAHATGPDVGGHCILARGVDMENNMVTLRNSWGQEWGDRGDCHITFDDLKILLDNQGECCIPMRQAKA